jgi:hypothetical protein
MRRLQEVNVLDLPSKSAIKVAEPEFRALMTYSER